MGRASDPALLDRGRGQEDRGHQLCRQRAVQAICHPRRQPCHRAAAVFRRCGGGTGGPGSGSGPGNAGGSGVVILKYPDSYTITIGAGLTGTTATDGSNRVTTITAGTGNVSWAAM